MLTDAGVSKDDVQTSGLSVYPEFDGDGEKIIGYTSSNSLTVTTHDLDGAGRIIDAAAGAVGDDIRIDGVWFSIEDTGELVKQARADAVRKAGEQAQQLAGAAGIGLGGDRDHRGDELARVPDGARPPTAAAGVLAGTDRAGHAGAVGVGDGRLPDRLSASAAGHRVPQVGATTFLGVSGPAFVA